MGDHLGQNETIFTGERVIPGIVEPDLWNEHIARYRYASLFAADRRVLDVGCGTGYGTAAMASMAADVFGFDCAPEAVQFAREHYGEVARFCLGSADAFPARSTWFDLVTAFEVIEHIAEWPALIAEASRVLKPTGMFLVSTPNKKLYQESRKEVGVNPFHVHEFEEQEFRAALEEKFRFVRILAQNQQASIVVAGEAAGQYGEVFVEKKPSLVDAQFFLAVCSFQRVSIPSFAYIPSGGNLVREREEYIEALKRQVEEARAQYQGMEAEYQRLDSEYRREMKLAREKLEEQQQEYRMDLGRARERLNELHDHLDERTRWALSLDERVKELEGELGRARNELIELQKERNAMRQSRWLKLGNALNLGPKLPDDPV